MCPVSCLYDKVRPRQKVFCNLPGELLSCSCCNFFEFPKISHFYKWLMHPTNSGHFCICLSIQKVNLFDRIIIVRIEQAFTALVLLGLNNKKRTLCLLCERLAAQHQSIIEQTHSKHSDSCFLDQHCTGTQKQADEQRPWRHSGRERVFGDPFINTPVTPENTMAFTF